MKQIKQTYLVLLIVISLFSLAIYSTYAMFTTEINTNNIVSIDTSISIDTSVEEYQITTIDSNSYKILDLSINNTEEDLYYGVWYELISGTNYNIRTYKLESSISPTIDIIKKDNIKNVSIVIINDTNKKATFKLGVATSQNSSLNINKERTLITETISDNDIKNQTAAEYIKNIYTKESKDLYYNNDNLIYYGETPNNYIILNKELWQIIGIYNNQLKLIKAENIGTYIYDNQNNDFENSQINILLNELYYKKNKGACYKNEEQEECDFSQIGLSEEVVEKMEIQTIDNEITSIQTPENINTASIMNETSFKTNVTLLSLSDYINSLNCTKDNCHNTWLTTENTMLLTQNINNNKINIISITDKMLTIDNPTNVNIEVRPVILLKENVIIVKGEGTKDKPYVLK